MATKRFMARAAISLDADVLQPRPAPMDPRRARLRRTRGLWDSVERLYNLFKQLKTSRAQPENGCSCRSGNGQNRQLKVEYISTSQRTSVDSDDNDDELECYGPPPPCHRPSALTITDLCDGRLTAQVSLRPFPPGDLLLRVYHNRLCFRLQKHLSDLDADHRITRAYHYADVEIPVFLEALSLHFWLDEESIRMEGATKGSTLAGLSLSTGDICDGAAREKKPGRLRQTRDLLRKCRKSRPDNTSNGLVAPDDFYFRCRAYTS